eukprot:186189_1
MACETQFDFVLALQLEQDDIIDYFVNEEDKQQTANHLAKQKETEISILSNHDIQSLFNTGIEPDELLQLYPHNKRAIDIMFAKPSNIQNVSAMFTIVCGYIRQHVMLNISFDIIDVCANYLHQSTFDTTFLTPNQATMLHQIFSNKLLTTNIEYDLLFRASEHKYSASKFHEFCDGKSSLVTIIKNEFGHIFGGYS